MSRPSSGTPSTPCVVPLHVATTLPQLATLLSPHGSTWISRWSCHNPVYLPPQRKRAAPVITFFQSWTRRKKSERTYLRSRLKYLPTIRRARTASHDILHRHLHLSRLVRQPASPEEHG